MSKAAQSYQGPLHQSAVATATDYWNDSCSIEELTYAIKSGAVGATTNPVIVLNVLQKEMHLWKDRIRQIVAERADATEDEISWQVIEELAQKGAELLKPVFDEHKGRKGRLSIQTSPKYHRNVEKLVEQTLHFQTLAPNIQVKIPATRAGIAAIEEVTYQGVSINATVSFTVPQALAVAEAVEKGLKRREAEGKDTSEMAPVCTLMVGRVDDWLKAVANRDNIITNADYLEWAGVAVMKHAYQLYQSKGYRTRLLAAAYRNHYQWSEFIGGDVVCTIPYSWALRFNGSDVTVEDRINNPVDQKIIDELRNKFDDFKQAYDADGMTIDQFDEYGATKRTLLQFLAGYDELVAVIRDFIVPNPDK